MKMTFFITLSLFAGIIIGWVIKPEPQKLNRRTLVTAAWYCEYAIGNMHPGRQKADMITALNNLNEGHISYDPDFVSSKEAVNFKLVILFANMYDARENFKFIPQTTSPSSRTSL